jgi:hypothetical protein
MYTFLFSSNTSHPRIRGFNFPTSTGLATIF